MKIAAIIEARMESTRLWGKVLFPIDGKPILQQLVNRIRLSQNINEVIIASPDTAYSSIIEKNITNVDYFHKGSMDNVFQRVLDAALTRNVDIIVCISADCPLVDFRHIDFLTKHIYQTVAFNTTHQLKAKMIEYASNYSPRTWPDGFDVAVFSTEAFIRLSKMKINKEHTGWNFTQFPNLFGSINLCAPEKYKLPHIEITLDTKEDYLLLHKIYDAFLYNYNMSAEDIIEYLLEDKELLNINKNVQRKIPGEL